MTTKREVCEIVADTIDGPRDEDYGPFVDNQQHIANLITAYFHDQLKTPCTAMQACHIGALIKLARSRTSPDKLDHHIDLAGCGVGAYLCAEDSNLST